MVNDNGLRAFVDAETREILALLGEGDGAEQGGCCGGSCGCGAQADSAMSAADVAAVVAEAANTDSAEEN